jgi:putative hydrolase of the HAD superfamily
VDIRCITFDLDDTLWDCMPVIEAAEQASYDWLAVHRPRITARHTLASLIDHRSDYMVAHPELHHDIGALRKRWIALLLGEHGYDDAAVAPLFEVFWHARNQVTLYEEARATLDALQGLYRLGSITNGNADVHYIGIGHYFDFNITAAAAGAAKPDARIYRAAIAAAGIAPERIVHVGDDPARDVAGAAAVGLRTVWVNVTGADWPGGAAPDAEVRHIGELPALLERWTA